MRHFYFISQKVFLMIFFIMTFTTVMGQQPNFTCDLRNDYLEDQFNIVFDVYCVNTSPAGSPTFEYAQGQLGFTINSSIKNGGTLSATVVSGFSDLSADQQWLPANVSFVATGTGGIKVTVRTPAPGAGFGDIISTTSPGTRLGRFRLTNSVAFAQAQANFAFSFATNPWPTKISAYLPVLTNITNTGTFTSNLTNPILNKPVTAFNVTGTGNYCIGGTGLEVGLDGSETGVTYTLVKNGTPTATTLAGTGSALNFQLQTAGTYTVTAARNATYITGIMTGSAIVGLSPLPASAGSVTGPAIVGQGLIGVQFSVSTIANATGYSWSLPTGASITAGSNTNAITVNFSNTASTGNVSVYGTNTCGNGTVSPNHAVDVYPGWKGTASADWATASNWTNGIVPGSAVNVYILPTANYMPVVNEAPGSPATCQNLYIPVSCSLTVAPGKALTVTGAVTNNASEGIILSSNAAGTATGSMIFNTPGVSGTVQRFIPFWIDDAHGWHFLSSPVANQTIQPTFVPTNPGSNQDFYAWDEVHGFWFNCKDSNLVWKPAFDASFVPGKGYLVAYNSSSAKSFSGILNVGNVTRTNLTRTVPGTNMGDVTPGWNLVGNPFTSAINWNPSGWSLPPNFGQVAKIWNEANASYTDINSNGIIPATQGFMVEVISETSGTLTIPASARTHSAQTWYKSTDNPNIKLIARNIDAQTAQECIISFDESVPPGYNPDYDSHYLPGYAPAFYTSKSEEKLSTCVLPKLTNQTTVPLQFSKTDGLSYAIEAEQIDNFKGPVYLTDLKMDYTQNLLENPVYNFTAENGDNPSRFLLSFLKVGLDEPANSGNQIYTYENNLYLVNPGKARVEIYNLNGQKLYSDEMNSSGLVKITLFVPTAYYIVRLTTGVKVTITKVFIKS